MSSPGHKVHCYQSVVEEKTPSAMRCAGNKVAGHALRGMASMASSLAQSNAPLTKWTGALEGNDVMEKIADRQVSKRSNLSSFSLACEKRIVVVIL